MGGFDAVFSTIKINKTLRGLNGRIIECKWDNGQWKFMRERTDKSFPNALKTAESVCNSIKNPVTLEILLKTVMERENNRNMPPPSTSNVLK